MARSKPKDVYEVQSLEKADETLALIGDLKRQVTVLETKMNEEIDHAKGVYADLAAPLQGHIARMETGLNVYATMNKRDLFKGKRSVVLDHGTIGYRKSSQIKPKSKITWAMVLRKLKDMKFFDAIRTKEEVNKDELAGWPDERLDLVGARRNEKDQFWYEVNKDVIADKGAA